ncbi:MAG: hypothetical protein JWL77_7130, partial [Chthonomonadaceae bacterium]|nr:hypothetical protein [Chthonomonadaceae bacterium]
QDVRKTLAKDLDVEDVTLLTDDQRLTLGDANGDRLISIRTALNGSTIVDLDKAGLPFPESEEPPNAPEIRRRIVEVWKSNPRIKPSPNDLTTEAVAKILLTLKGTADSTKSRLYDSTAKRLQIGLSCESIRKLMEECGLHVSLDSISLAVDTCVDSGPAVPKIVCEDGFWFRAFYSGEASDSDHCAQFKSAFHVGYQELRKSKKRGRPLTPFDVQKLCVCLKDLCPFLPLARYFHTFGACVNVGTDRKDLIQWLVDSDVREVSPVTKTSDGSKELLESNPYFEPCMLETWTPQQRREFSEAFHYLGTAFQRLPDDAKLLLSTCCNHHETFGAVAFEAYSWAERPRSNFGFVLSSVRTDLSRRGALQHESISAMYWVVQFIAECRRKLHVFDKSHSILEKLNAEFKRQGPSAQVFWEYVKGRGTINLARDPAIVYRMEMLRPVLTQMTLLTTFFIKVLEAAGLLTEGHLYDELKRHGLRSDDRHVQWLEVTARDAASSYNEYVRTSPEPLDAHCKALLPLGRLLPPAAGVDEWCRRQIVQTRECFNEIVAVLQDFCPRYDVTTGESEYAPNAMRRRRKGAVEIDKEGVYVLSVALGGSFDRGFRDRFYMRIDQAVRNFEVLLFEENKHGHFTVAAVEVGKIFRIISVIQEIEFGVGPKAGSQYKMRMAIAYGPMTMVLKDTGERALRGTRRSHPLAQVKILLREFRRSKADLGRTKDVLLLTNEAYRAMAGIPSAPQALRAAQVIPGPNPYMSDYLVELPI